MTAKNKKLFGLWPSPISPTTLGQGMNFTDLAWDQSGALVWRETRSKRGVLVVQPSDGQASRDLNSEYNVRASVGYGGGDFTVSHGFVYFVEAESGRIYRQPLETGLAKPITPAFGKAASPAISPDGRFLLFVHSYNGEDSLGLAPVDGEHWPVRLVSGDDFYMQPCSHPNSRAIAWIAWNHPQMPWDGTTLWLGTLKRGENGPQLREAVPIVGGENVAVFQPQFSPDGRYLAYVADPEGWWHLYLYDLENKTHRALTTGEAEHAFPAWVQGLRTYGFNPDGTGVYFLRNQQGCVSLRRLDIHSGHNDTMPVGEEYTWLNQLAVSPEGERVALIASGARTPQRVVIYTALGGSRVVRRSMAENLPPETYALPKAIRWSGLDGGEVHGLYYAPQSKTYVGVGKPPLIVLIHGGPTSQRGMSFDSQAQFFTSRGWGVLQVNYRGSTGYGRAYREMLKGQWGIYDVQDAVSGARVLSEEGEVDPEKRVIMGGSAGGFTVLKALEDYPGFFKAGICLYGVANQFTLVADTHKFEERYSDSLLGSLPEAAPIYRERSPAFFVDRIQDPVAIFQGEEDQVVPRSQSDEIVAALQRNGVHHEYHLYPGEGHGFRKAETIEKFYQAVERFLKQYVIYA